MPGSGEGGFYWPMNIDITVGKFVRFFSICHKFLYIKKEWSFSSQG